MPIASRAKPLPTGLPAVAQRIPCRCNPMADFEPTMVVGPENLVDSHTAGKICQFGDGYWLTPFWGSDRLGHFIPGGEWNPEKDTQDSFNVFYNNTLEAFFHPFYDLRARDTCDRSE